MNWVIFKDILQFELDILAMPQFRMSTDIHLLQLKFNVLVRMGTLNLVGPASELIPKKNGPN